MPLGRPVPAPVPSNWESLCTCRSDLHLCDLDDRNKTPVLEDLPATTPECFQTLGSGGGSSLPQADEDPLSPLRLPGPGVSPQPYPWWTDLSRMENCTPLLDSGCEPLAPGGLMREDGWIDFGALAHCPHATPLTHRDGYAVLCPRHQRPGCRPVQRGRLEESRPGGQDSALVGIKFDPAEMDPCCEGAGPLSRR